MVGAAVKSEATSAAEFKGRQYGSVVQICLHHQNIIIIGASFKCRLIFIVHQHTSELCYIAVQCLSVSLWYCFVTN